MLKKLIVLINNRVWKKITDIVFPVVLVCFSLMHVAEGLTVTDTGYNYGNFVFFQSLDDMWKFSTYLANVVGAFFVKLPLGETVLGLNIYTGLVKTLAALLSYFLGIYVCKLRKEFVFLGEMLALGFSWCPTALLYNYLTYLFFNLAAILIFFAFKYEKNRYWVLAGVCLGLNFMVRIPNLAEIVLILCVWYGAFLYKKQFKQLLSSTLYCVLGYVLSIGSIVSYISIRYGFSAYVEGIQELFAMTENATSYSAMSMVMGAVWDYYLHWKWFAALIAIILLGTIIFAIMKKRFVIIKNIIVFAIMGLYVFIAYIRKQYTLDYRNYSSMYFWGVLFLMVSLGVCVYTIFLSKREKEMKLLASMAVILIFITPIGSNNGLYSSVNNLYFVAPIVFSSIGDLLYVPKRVKIIGKVEIATFPMKAVLTGLVCVVLFQSVTFGMSFVFRDGIDGQDRNYVVVNNQTLVGMKTTEKNAQNLQELNDYLLEADRCQREVLLYGDVPALAFYFSLKPAISSTWPDLDSFSYEKFSEEMNLVATKEQLPLVITNAATKVNMSEYRNVTTGGSSREKKLIKLQQFLQENQYKESYSNEAFVVYEIVR